MSPVTTPDFMRAQVLEAFGTPYKLQTRTPVPTIEGPHDVLIKVDAAGYCHTDEIVALGQFPTKPPLPFIGSHEIAGTVVQADPSTGLKPGDRVGSPGRGYRPCGQCLECCTGLTPDGDGDPVGFSILCPAAKSERYQSQWRVCRVRSR
jgi:propanol-preferring alcohol dehydrogenase